MGHKLLFWEDFTTKDIRRSLLPKDGLGHDMTAEWLLLALDKVPDGSIVALQGPWGRGKTDTLARAVIRTYDDQFKEKFTTIAPKAYWMDPWYYQETNLIAPLLEMLTQDYLNKSQELARQFSQAGVDIEQAAEKLTRNLCKYASVLTRIIALVPGSEPVVGILEGIKGGYNIVSDIIPRPSDPGHKIYPPFVQIVRGIIEGLPQPAEDLPTPSQENKSLPQLFREMAESIIRDFGDVEVEPGDATGSTPKRRLLIAIDDIDRCMPERQVKLLEAYHFVTSTKAPVIFLMGINPSLVQESIKYHYQIPNFNIMGYLNKIITFRMDLPPVVNENFNQFVLGVLCDKQPGGGPLLGEDFLSKILWKDPEDVDRGTKDNLIEAFNTALSVQVIRNPRLVEKIVFRLNMFSQRVSSSTDTNAGDTQDLDIIRKILKQPTRLANLIRWLAICEQWSEVRQVLRETVTDTTVSDRINNWEGTRDEDQKTQAFSARFRELSEIYTDNTEGINVSYDLPSPKTNADLVEFFRSEANASDEWPVRLKDYHHFEWFLQQFGI